MSGTTATIVYGTTSFGQPGTGTVTLYGGTSSSPTTSIDTTNTTGNKTFSHTGLTPGTTYYYRARANNGQLNSNYSTEGSITVPIPATQALYGSVNGQSKRIEKIYGPVAGVVSLDGNIASGGAGNVHGYNGETFLKTLRTKAPAQAANIDDIDKIQVYVRMSGSLVIAQLSISVHSSSAGTYTRVENVYDPSTSVASSILREWGFVPYTYASGTDIVNITGTTQGFLSKKITKLYGSVNGQTKLIYSA